MAACSLQEKMIVLFIENILQKLPTTDFIQGLGGLWPNQAENTVINIYYSGRLAMEHEWLSGYFDKRLARVQISA